MSNFVRFVLAIPAKMREDDKRKHIAWSFLLTLLALFFLPIVAAIILVFLIGLAKEYWDRFYGSGFCFFDMVGNFLGIIFALSIDFVFFSVFPQGCVL